MEVFDSKVSFVQAAGSETCKLLSDAVSHKGHANLLLSGGSTPGPVYRYISEHCQALKKTRIGLVDERYVSIDSEFSNEALIKECFSESENVPEQILGMVFDLKDPSENLRHLETNYSVFKEGIDVLILGMGTDGHFASIFPNDLNSEEALVTNEKFLNTNAPKPPKSRITTSLSYIQKAHQILLFISGEDKFNILKNASLNLPIHTLLTARPDVKIYYLEKS
jgi:6-phosphogluconolactonase